MQLTRASTRILLPFQLRPARASQSLDWDGNLQQLASAWDQTPSGRRGPHRPHSSYYLEYLPHAQRFLYDGTGESGCHYFKLANEALRRYPRGAQAWLGNLHPQAADASRGRHSRRGLQLVGAKADTVWRTPQPFDRPDARLNLRVSLIADSGIELWLSRMGVGLLSLSLLCEPLPRSTDGGGEFFQSLLELNHALATAHKAVWLRDASERPPTHLHQVARDLLRPLWDRAEAVVEFELRGKVFTAIEAAIRRDGETPDQLAPCQQQLSQLLTHVAQLHPPSHPGEPDEGHAVRLAINNQHLCYIDQSGAAHATIVPLVANANDDSDVDADADAERDPVDGYAHKRLRRVQMEYFPGFLLAVIQRLCLQHMLNESTAVSAMPVEQQEAARQELLAKVLRFGLEGEFVQIAWRTTVQKHHELTQQACEVQEGLAAVRHAMNDFHRMAAERAAEQQREEAERAAHQRHEETERAERTMQVLEVFIVTFYSVELAHILGESFEFGHTPVGFWPFGDTPFVAWSLMGVAVATFLMAALLISWDWLKAKGTRWTIISLFVMATAIHAAFLFANWQWNLRQPNATVPNANGKLHDGLSSQIDHIH